MKKEEKLLSAKQKAKRLEKQRLKRNMNLPKQPKTSVPLSRLCRQVPRNLPSLPNPMTAVEPQIRPDKRYAYETKHTERMV